MILKKIAESAYPLLVFPEGWDTNGKVGLVQFQKFLFSIGVTIQPVSLQCTVVGLSCALPGVLGSSIVKEFLFMLFTPFYEYELSFLPPQVIILIITYFL